jgi:hypothetical protein
MKARSGSNAWLRYTYRWLNKDYFENKLPKRLPVKWAKLPGTVVARAKFVSRTITNYKNRKKIVIEKEWKPILIEVDRSLRHDYLASYVGMCLLHEMNHVMCGVDEDCKTWDGKFDKGMFRLTKQGAFQPFW